MPNADGGMDEAHRYYRVVQSETWDLRLPVRVSPSKGPKTVFNPPNYSPMPNEQRVQAAVADLQDSKSKLDAVRNQAEQQMAADKNTQDQLAQQGQDIQSQIQAAMSAHSQAAPSPVTPAGQAGAQAVDPLASWGQTVGK